MSKAVVDSALGGEPERVETYGARFTGHVFPGETLVTRVWKGGDDRLILSAETKERGTTVLANASITMRD